MAKQISQTPAITTQMQGIAGEGVDVSGLPVFEAIVGNTLPLKKKGSIYDKAQMSQGMLADTASFINAKGVPLHTLHQQGGELPIGKVFSASVVMNDIGQPELHALFYVAPEHADLSGKLNNGVIDEVSLGILSACALCSECGFDYFGADATTANFWDRTCANDHTIGEDGVHLNLTGLDGVYELSLVSVGAVQGSKVVSGSKTRMTGETKLAASGVDLNAAILNASFKEGRKMAGETFNVNELIGKFSDAQVELSTSKATIATLTADVARLTAANVELTAKIPTAATPTETEAKLTAANTELTASKATVDAATKFLRDMTRKALVATAQDVSKVDEMSIDAMTAAIEAAQAKLSSLFPAGGKALGAIEDADKGGKPAAHLSAFQTRK
jgi:hypothetical protein